MHISRILTALFLTLGPAAMTGSAFGQPIGSRGFMDPAGPVAQAQFHHFGVIVAIMMIVLVPIFIALPILLIRYRRGGNGAYRPKWSFSWGIEATIWGVPLAIVGFLAVALWHFTFKFDPYKPLGDDPLQVEVVALDWKFLFLYPEQGVATVDYLAIPAGRPVSLRLTSGTVMQSFMIPQLAGQIYTMAGMQTQLNLMADDAGEYIGRNTQYNGNGFSGQSFTTAALAPTEFDAWVDRQRAITTTLDWKGYQELAKPAVQTAPEFFGNFEPELFTKVIASFAPYMVPGDDQPNSAYQAHHQHGTTEGQQ